MPSLPSNGISPHTEFEGEHTGYVNRFILLGPMCV